MKLPFSLHSQRKNVNHTLALSFHLKHHQQAGRFLEFFHYSCGLMIMLKSVNCEQACMKPSHKHMCSNQIIKWKQLIICALGNLHYQISRSDKAYVQLLQRDMTILRCEEQQADGICNSTVQSMFLNTMFPALMGRFQLESKLKFPLFSSFTVILFSWLCQFLQALC